MRSVIDGSRALLVLGAAALVGVTEPVVAQASQVVAPPGRLVDIGGRTLHVHCTGAGAPGAPTVLLEAGASSFAIDWTLVQREIARTTRICSYDRAGQGWSDAPAGGGRAAVVSDLHSLLRAAGERAPFVMVGASMGGLYVREYHADHPDDVVGLVLVDPSSEARLFTYFQGEAVTIASLTAEQYRSTIPPGSVDVPRRAPQTGVPFDRLPADLYEQRVKLDEKLIASTPATITYETRVEWAEIERGRLARLSAMSVRSPNPLGDRPLVVLTRDQGWSQGLHDTHAGLARLSTNSRHTVVTGSGHEVHLFEPAVVVQAITDVLDAVRSKSRLPSR
jgi:pimeloyl-ACP methyl ester carboxylesterase